MVEVVMLENILIPERIPLPTGAIVDAASRGKLAIFVGAGLSRLVGSPLWEGFAESALKQLCDQGVLNVADLELFRQAGISAKIRASIAKDAAITARKVIDYRRILEPNPNPDLGLVKRLISIGNTFVTTNYDLWLEKASELPETRPSNKQDAETKAPADGGRPQRFKSICLPGDIWSNELLKPNQVIHLHGSIERPELMVVSTRDYLVHYNLENIVEFLRFLFREFVVVFIGYGVEESEILEHVFRKQDSKVNVGESGRHFWLFPAFTFQGKLLYQLAQYYRQNCNVELLPYQRDEQDYRQLENIIPVWAERIRARPAGFLEKAAMIDGVFDG